MINNNQLISGIDCYMHDTCFNLKIPIVVLLMFLTRRHRTIVMFLWYTHEGIPNVLSYNFNILYN